MLEAVILILFAISFCWISTAFWSAVFGFVLLMGLRIDLILVGDALKQAAKAAAIDRTPRRWERPSDHTPVTLDLDI